MIIDSAELSVMSVNALWANYLEAMDAVITAIEMDEKPEAMFYMAVVKISLDLYFDGVERILCQLNS